MHKAEWDDSILTDNQLTTVVEWGQALLDELSTQDRNKMSFRRAVEDVNVNSIEGSAIWAQINSTFEKLPYDPFDRKSQQALLKLHISTSGSKRNVDIQDEDEDRKPSPRKSPKIINLQQEREAPLPRPSPRRLRSDINHTTWHNHIPRNYTYDKNSKELTLAWHNDLIGDYNKKHIPAYGELTGPIATTRLETLVESLAKQIHGSRGPSHKKYWAVVEIIRKSHADFHISDVDFGYMCKVVIKYGRDPQTTFGSALQHLRRSASNHETRPDVTQCDQEYIKDRTKNLLKSDNAHVLYM